LLDFTIEAFIYRLSDAHHHSTILGNMLSAFVANSRFFMVYGATNATVNVRQKLAFGGNATTIGNPLLLSQSTLTLNRWHHIAVTRQGGIFRMFIDGRLEATATKNVTVDFSQNGTAIGNNGWDADGFFIGYIDELRVTKGRARYIDTFTPPDAPFVFASGT
ncbi:MAG: LamG domain-containing protein, partial [Azoarcus sp.]|nr:LamG domain-containing protein [Azoarcus sp.]